MSLGDGFGWSHTRHLFFSALDDRRESSYGPLKGGEKHLDIEPHDSYMLDKNATYCAYAVCMQIAKHGSRATIFVFLECCRKIADLSCLSLVLAK